MTPLEMLNCNLLVGEACVQLPPVILYVIVVVDAVFPSVCVAFRPLMLQKEILSDSKITGLCQRNDDPDRHGRAFRWAGKFSPKEGFEPLLLLLDSAARSTSERLPYPGD